MSAAAPPRPRLFTGWRIAGWGTLAGLLVLPAVAMRYTAEVMWTPFDFAFAAVLFGLLGTGVEIAFRRGRNRWHTFGLILTALTGFLTVWINGAVGIVGREDEPPGFLFLLSIVLGIAASLAVRFRPAPMRLVALALAAATLVLGLGAHALLPGADKWGPFLIFTLLWFASSALFHAAVRRP